MDREKRIALVADVCKRREWLDEQFMALDAVTGCDLGSGLWRTVEGLFEAHLAVVAEVLGDDCGLLSWFVHDNECGRGGLAAGAEGKTAPVTTPAQLVDLIEAAP